MPLNFFIRIEVANEWFHLLDERVRTVIDQNRKESQKPVRVAILDTGVDAGHSLIGKSLNKNIVVWKGFPEKSYPLKDVSGHGTYLACVLMRTAPQTLLHIGRIFNDEGKFADSEVTKVISSFWNFI